MKKAIIEAGGKQFLVKEGDKIKIEKIKIEEGADIVFDKVLYLEKEGEIAFGTPYLEDIKIKGKVLSHGKHKKVIVFKFKPKKRSKRKKGHRQPYTEILIEKIETK